MDILFESKGKAIPPNRIETCVREFGQSYSKTVRDIIARSQTALTQDIFFENVAQLMPNFKMTRRGCFKGVEYKQGIAYDPNGQISACWSAGGDDVIQIKNFLAQQPHIIRRRIIVDIPDALRGKIVLDLRQTLKNWSQFAWER